MKINIFELLEVDECADSDTRELSDLTLSPLKSSNNKMARQKDNLNTEPNWMFEAYCTFQDFDDIRQHMMQL